RRSTTTGNNPSVKSPGPGTLPPQLLTYTFAPSAEVTAVYGKVPTATRRTIARVAVSITATWFELLSATYSRAPSGLSARPLGAEPAIGIVPSALNDPSGAAVKSLTSLLAPPPT